MFVFSYTLCICTCMHRKHIAVRIQRDLGEFKLKVNMGLGAFFGDQQVHGTYVHI